jgi:hypothetical protein
MAKIHNRTKQEFLLSFFPSKDVYDEKEVNGFWLVKQWNGFFKCWEVHIFSKDSFKRYSDNQRTRFKTPPELSDEGNELPF